ncbi:MAG: hypothetical protein NZ919_01860, partial [Candidatus Caldarchaeum sp.]|nr:hypothetical protein [Candidatus Caldarchaeum sp.]
MRFGVAAALVLFVLGFIAGYLVDGEVSTATSVSTTTLRQTTTTTKTTTIATTVVATARNPVVGGKAVDIVASVYRVVDGDTFDCFPAGRVRLADVNTPERGQPGYTEATNALRMLVEGKTV